jgi:hypothetical protein
MMEEKKIEATMPDIKVFLKINEKEEEKDFTFMVPQGCNYEMAKRGILSTFEYIIKLELEAIRLAKEEEAKKAATPVVAEVM